MKKENRGLMIALVVIGALILVVLVYVSFVKECTESNVNLQPIAQQKIQSFEQNLCEQRYYICRISCNQHPHSSATTCTSTGLNTPYCNCVKSCQDTYTNPDGTFQMGCGEVD